MLGDSLLSIALPYYVYAQTGSVLAMGLMFAMELVPGLIFGPLAGVLVDRWHPTRTMVLADFVRAVILLPLLWLPAADWLWLVYVVVFSQSVFSQFYTPARGAVLPRLVDAQQLLAANALSSVSFNITRLGGPLLGGALFGWLGLTSVVVLDAVSFLLSASLIARITVPATQPTSQYTELQLMSATGWGHLWSDLRAGLQQVQQAPWLRSLFTVLVSFQSSTLAAQSL